MTYSNKSRWVDYLIFGLSIFLIFCLVLDAHIELPRFVGWIGRWHPVMLHFPIVLLLICVFLGLTGKKISKLLLTLTVLFTLLTAISGFFLGKEVGTKGDLLFWHQWLGGALALLAALWYWLEGIQVQNQIVSKVLQVAIIGLVLVTGHYGGMVTHGEDFLALPAEKRQEKIPENPFIYKDIVGRILDDKCLSCHNANKKKGGLLMTSLNELIAGGEVGNTIIPGNPQESELIRRIHLPFEDEERMPPEGKQPLEANEIQILERWIALGASDTLQLSQLEPAEPLTSLVQGLMEVNPTEKWKSLPKIADSTMNRLSSDYLTINRITGGIDALSVNIYKSPTYTSQPMIDLEPIAHNIVQMDVSGLPIGQEEMNFIAACKNIEWLEIDQTPITDTEVDTLKILSKLRVLKLFGTAVSDKSISVLRQMKGLQQVYVWNTTMSNEALNRLRSERPSLFIDSGIDEEVQASFIISDTIPKN